MGQRSGSRDGRTPKLPPSTGARALIAVRAVAWMLAASLGERKCCKQSSKASRWPILQAPLEDTSKPSASSSALSRTDTRKEVREALFLRARQVAHAARIGVMRLTESVGHATKARHSRRVRRDE